MWVKRLVVSLGLVVASMFVVPAVSGAATNCVQTESMQEPTCTVIPVVSDNSATAAASGTTTTGAPNDPAASAATTTSLPFTGADVEELAVVGAGAVLAGGLLLRRRRTA